MKNRKDCKSGEIFARQLDIFNPEDVNVPIHVVGVGATGSFDAIALAKVGFPEIHVWDPDKVEDLNTAGQAYGLEHEGELKVEALHSIVQSLAGIDLVAHPQAWDGHALEGIIIMGADSMAVRKKIFYATYMKTNILLVCDHRIGGHEAQLFAYQPTDPVATDDFKGSLFRDEVAAQLPCTLRSVIDINFLVASLTTRNIRSFLKDGSQALVYEIHYNAKTMTFTSASPGKPYHSLRCLGEP